MVHFTIFGGSDVRLTGGSKVIVTIFGGTDVHKPTLARRIMAEKHQLEHQRHQQEERRKMSEDKNWWQGAAPQMQPSAVRRPHTFALTIFGGVEIKPPSLAEEFMDMRELVASGTIGRQEWDRLIGQLYSAGESEGMSSFTLFGGIGEETIPTEEEVKKIRSARELGLIDQDEELALRSIVGKDREQVRMLIRDTAFA